MIYNFKEELLHFIWQHGLFDVYQLKTVEGQPLLILDKGILNTDSGPDFTNAMIEIDGIKWAGNIEIHINTSDWNKHKHQYDKSYNNTILHVVYIHDKNIQTEDQNDLPILELKDRIPNIYIEKYKFLQLNKDHIACKKSFKDIRGITKEHWLSRLISERLINKSATIKELLNKEKFNWEQTFYILLASNFGFKINNESMRFLAQSVPLNILAKYKDSLLQLEAILFGQAGFLEVELNDSYHQKLRAEYIHLKKKFTLSTLPPSIWKMMRTRPVNFPTIRIAQFASLIHKSSFLFSKIMDIKHFKEAFDLFDCEASTYWDTHYQFGEESIFRKKKIGKNSIENILTNTVIPMMYLYGMEKNQDSYCEKAIDFLYEIPAEKNYIISEWMDIGWTPKNMADSQSLIHLKNNYCNQKKCLSCNIGKEILVGTKKGLD
ncbi:MAG: DUF2851 family protein [Bacteroidetes bacterium]|nr:DUF2851 family protein [Bacteroidota bacterium]